MKKEGIHEDVTGVPALLTTDCVVLELPGGMHKPVSYLDFIKLLPRVDEIDSGEDGFQFPPGVFYFKRSKDVIHMSTYHPESNRTLTYTGWGSEPRLIVTPNIIISYFLVREESANGLIWRMKETYYFSTDLDVTALPNSFINKMDPLNHIFGLPFTNYRHPSGLMCYGKNSVPLVFPGNNLKYARWYYDFLWESPFNDDLGLGSVKQSARPSHITWYNLLAELAKTNSAFPYNKLQGYPT